MIDLPGLISCNDDGTIYGFNENFVLLLLGYTEHEVANKPITSLLPSIFDDMQLRGPLDLSGLSNSDDLQQPKFLEGLYQGTAKHTDGSSLAVLYQIRTIMVESGESMHCIWLSADCLTDETADIAEMDSRLESSSLGVVETAQTDLVREEKMRAEQGLSSKYTALAKLGEGSFGFVERCVSIETRKQFVVKFIRKDKVLSECWETHDRVQVPLNRIEDDFRPGEIPREVILLYTLQHDNVVKAVRVMHKQIYLQVCAIRLHPPCRWGFFFGKRHNVQQ